MELAIITAGIVAGTSMLLYIENNWLKVSRHEYSSEKLPKAFKGTRIVHLSDLHSKSFGRDNERLIRKVKGLKPHIILFTGDLVDSRRYEEEISSKTIEELAKIAPLYFSVGNHENRTTGYPKSLEAKLKERGAKVLRNDGQIFLRNGTGINIIGIDDPLKEAKSYKNSKVDEEFLKKYIDKAFEKLGRNKGSFTLLLSHRPEHIKAYAEKNIDIAFSGHAHGGQIRIPFLGHGLFAPHQGSMPRFAEGKHKEGNTTLYISRGLGNSSFPFRVFNRPEIIFIELK